MQLFQHKYFINLIHPTGYVEGDAELSEYYKVKFGGGVRKGFKVAVTMPRLPNDELVRMQFAMMGWSPSVNDECMMYQYVDVTYVDGAYVAEIPPMESPDEVNETEVWFGVTKCDPVEGIATSRARSDYLVGRNDYVLYNKVKVTDEVKDFLAELKYSWIPSAIDKLEELGFNKPEGAVINCYLYKDAGIWKYFGGDVSGWCSFTSWGKKYATINLSYEMIAKKQEGEIRGTIIHELFHYYQQFYDTRSAPRFTHGGKSTATILEEASSVWSERFYSPLPSVAKENANVFVPSINPDHKDVVAASKAKLSWGERYPNVGYGAATLLEYLSQKCGNDIILEMWEERKTGDPFDTRDRIERIAKKNGVNIFTQDTYHDFVEKLGCGELYSGQLFSFDELVNYREEHDSIGVLTRTYSNSNPYYFTNYVYGYGALVEKLHQSGYYDNDWEHGLENATGIIEQTTDGVTTWVYKTAARGKFIPCGMVRKGSPMKILPGWFYKANNLYRNQDFYFVTIADDFKTESEPVSRIVTRIVRLDVAEKKVSIPADEGRKIIKVKTNTGDLTVKSTVNWLTCYLTPSDSTLTVIYDALPGHEESRTGTIQFIAHSEDYTQVVLEEIELSQVKAFIDLSATEVEVPVEGGNFTVSITSTNCENIKVSTTNNFLHPTLSGSTITVKGDPNTSYERREGSVKVSGTMPVTGIKVERFISFTQAAAPSPDEVNLYNDGWIDVVGLRINIPGKTMKYGDYLLYRSADTEIEKTSTKRQEFSWDVKLYIDPKDNKSMRHYEFYSGSVSWLLNRYWTEKDSEGKEIERQETQRCSYNLKNLITKDAQSFYSGNWGGIDETEYKMGDFVSDYSYQKTVDGKPVETVMQAEISNNRAALWDAWVHLTLADGVPYLEADRDSISFGGGDTFEILQFSNNDAVHDVEITTSDNWFFIDRIFKTDLGGRYYINTTINQSKATRTGYVYITGTLADGSKLTCTVVVTQIYEAVWDKDPTITEGQKAELPTQAVLDALQGAGMPLYLGSAPPKLNGIYKMEPLRTIYQTREDTGDDGYVTNLVLKMSSNSSSPDKALMSYYSHLKTGQNSSASDHCCYLSGNGDSFTLSNIYKVDYEGLFSWTVVTVVSGTIEGNSIRNLHFGMVELDDAGQIENMSIGTDGDGISGPATWEPGEDDY